MQFLSPEADRLLRLARHLRVLVDLRRQDRIMLKLADLCRSLTEISRGVDTAPPSFLYEGASGRFGFRAHWLNSAVGDETSLIGVTVEYRAPLTLLILRALKPFPLSSAQRQIAQWLAQGFSFVQIGSKQHIKTSTVKDHVHAIYTKLGVRNRDEILPRLISGAGFRDGTRLN